MWAIVHQLYPHTFNLLPVDSHLTDRHVELLGYVEELHIKGPTEHMENVAIITQLIRNKCSSLKSGESVPGVFRVDYAWNDDNCSVY